MRKPTVNAVLESTIFQNVTQFLSQSQELGESAIDQKNNEPVLELLDYYQPQMLPGEYNIIVRQFIYNKTKNVLLDTYETKKKVVVSAPLRPLTSVDIHHYYPPKSSFGDYTEILPHIVLNQKSLPWEKRHASSEKGIPWLALVVLNEDEVDVNAKPGQKIKLDKSLVPDKEALTYLAHVIKPKEGKEKAVLIANRLPTPERHNVVHLIAVHEENEEGTYTSLFSWNFSCEASKNSLQSMLERLNTGLFHLPDAKLPDGTNADRATKNKLAKINQCLQQGFVPLPHFARNGHRIISWYRSPLTPFDVDMTFNIRYISNADQLLRYFKKTQRLDTTYATAWELGKWLTMERKEIAIAMYNWKKQFAVSEKQKIRNKKLEKNRDGRSLNAIEAAISEVVKNESAKPASLPQSVKDWLIELVKLRPIPFANLVPDQQLLPEESIRFFHVDEGWIWALIDGALSIGRQPTNKLNSPISVEELYLMGCILRSEAIVHFPDLIITADGRKLPLEQRLIGKDILLCIFSSKQPLKTVEIFLKPEGTHFGVDQKYIENKANENGTAIGQAPAFVKKFFAKPNERIGSQKVSVPLKDAHKRILDIPELAKQMGTTRENQSSTFALRMLESAPKVIFKCKAPT